MVMPAGSRRHSYPMRSLLGRPHLRIRGLLSRIMDPAPTSGDRAAASCPLDTDRIQPLRPSAAPPWLALMPPRTPTKSRACIPATSTRCSTWGTVCQPRHHPPHPCRPHRCPLRDQLRRPLRPLLPIAMQCAIAHRTARTTLASAAAAPSAEATPLHLHLHHHLRRPRPRLRLATAIRFAIGYRIAPITRASAVLAPSAPKGAYGRLDSKGWPQR